MRWEYKIIKHSAKKHHLMEKELNELGHKDWELVNLSTIGFGDDWEIIAFLKREWREKMERIEFLTSELRILEQEVDSSP